jgi:hypothetical protein
MVNQRVVHSWISGYGKTRLDRFKCERLKYRWHRHIEGYNNERDDY